MRLTATIITLNEEKNLGRALNSLRSVVDEIVVIDSGSTDRTESVAREHADQFLVNDWPGYAAQKNFAASQASHDWILNLDADEALSDQLQDSIGRLRAAEPGTSAYRFARKTFYLNRWIGHSGWYPDYKVRLYNRTAASWTGDYVHESLQVTGLTETLPGDLLHYSIANLSEHISVVDRYTTLAAEELMAKGSKARVADFLVSPLAAFLKSYFIKQGFRDGMPGLFIAGFASYYVFLKFAKLWELDYRSKE